MVRRKSIARSIGNSRSPHEKSKTNVLTSKKRVRDNYVLREVQHLQTTVHSLIPKAVFSRVVRGIIFDLFPDLINIRIQATALEALQVAAEAYLVQLFEDSILITMHAKRVVLQVRDVRLVRRLRGRDDVTNK
ncbi:histone H3.3 type b-like [Lasioglossum baleicum]|uniref:histone H3.3 type b-like n=1 Tax=Lasioglossum baleicum TaxID=434251 RepID=UPI003FCE547C